MMSLIVEQTWRLPEVETVFSLHFRFDLDLEGEDFWVDVECVREAQETKRVLLSPGRPTPIALAFRSGDNLNGKMTVVLNGGRKATSVNVNALLHYDRHGREPVQHFQGYVLYEASPSPLPPPCPEPPRVGPDCDDPPDEGPQPWR